MAAPDIALDGAWGASLVPQYFSMTSGDDRTLTVTIRDRAGAAASLTGTFTWVLCSGPKRLDGIEITKTGSITAGVATVTLADTDTDDLDGEYFHEMTAVETSSSAESVVLRGRATISGDAE